MFRIQLVPAPSPFGPISRKLPEAPFSASDTFVCRWLICSALLGTLPRHCDYVYRSKGNGTNNGLARPAVLQPAKNSCPKPTWIDEYIGPRGLNGSYTPGIRAPPNLIIKPIQRL